MPDSNEPDKKQKGDEPNTKPLRMQTAANVFDVTGYPLEYPTSEFDQECRRYSETKKNKNLPIWNEAVLI